MIQTAKESLTKKGRYDNHGVVNCHFGELDIKVGIDSISRMLLFTETLVNVLIKRGHHIEVSSHETFACVNGQQLKILFRERLKKHVVEGKYYNSTELHSTGILVFRLDGYHGKEWKDRKEKLEYCLPDIVATLEIESKRQNQRDEEHRKERLVWERQEQIKKELQARKEKDLSDFKRTMEKAKRWHKVVSLRNYIDEVERKGAASAESLNWARQKADWYDPFIETADEMLNEIDRETLAPSRKALYGY